MDGEKRYSYREFNEWVNRLTHYFWSLGIEKGDKIALMMQNSSDFLAVFYATAKAGAVAVPVNYRLTKPEAAYILDHSDSVLAIVDKEYETMVREIALENEAALESDVAMQNHIASESDAALAKHTKSEDGKLRHILVAGVDTGSTQLGDFSTSEPANFSGPAEVVTEADDCEILYTSGTTGRPKGALFDHHRVIHVGITMMAAMGVNERDRLLHVAPMYHCAELNLFVVSGVHVGATHVIARRFDPKEVLARIRRERISLFFGVPTMYNMMLQHYDAQTDDLSSVTRCGYGAAPMAPALVTRSMEMFGTKQFYNLAGLTEGGPNGVLLRPEDHDGKLGTSGRALSSSEARVVDVVSVVNGEDRDVLPGEVGEFIIKAETVMKEYYKNPAATQEALRDGWLYTGDLATIDEDGFIAIVDRKKDMVISGGENIYSTEVENVLYRHPKVLDAAVIGIPDDQWGEAVAAVVVTKAGDEITLEELREFCRDHLAAYKLPRVLLQRDVLPRNPSGKVMKFVLREEYRA